MDQELKGWLDELEVDVLARNAPPEDPMYGTLWAAKCELSRDEPNYGYVRQMVGHALRKPLDSKGKR